MSIQVKDPGVLRYLTDACAGLVIIRRDASVAIWTLIPDIFLAGGFFASALEFRDAFSDRGHAQYDNAVRIVRRIVGMGAVLSKTSVKIVGVGIYISPTEIQRILLSEVGNGWSVTGVIAPTGSIEVV